MTVTVNIQLVNEYGAIPAYETNGAAGADIRAAIERPLDLYPGDRQLIPCGFKLEIPVGYEAQVRPRSGLAAKRGVTVLNSPGTIDSDFRGELHVILINHGHLPFTVLPGERIAQLVIAPVVQAHFARASCMSTTVRGESGFGSTGTK